MAAALVGLISMPGLADLVNPIPDGSGGNTVVADHASPLSLVETITDIGGGFYRYEYSMVNTDTSPIWHLGVFTRFSAVGNQRFSGHPTWGGPSSNPVTSVASVYDGRNLDPSITHVTNTWTSPWEDPVTSIQVGESTSGYSFTASVYDPSAKWYYYETLASGYAVDNGTGHVAAIGQTVPIPAPGAAVLALIGLGLVGRIRRLRG